MAIRAFLAFFLFIKNEHQFVIWNDLRQIASWCQRKIFIFMMLNGGAFKNYFTVKLFSGFFHNFANPFLKFDIFFIEKLI